jgi:hypothetical protein
MRAVSSYRSPMRQGKMRAVLSYSAPNAKSGGKDSPQRIPRMDETYFVASKQKYCFDLIVSSLTLTEHIR